MLELILYLIIISWSTSYGKVDYYNVHIDDNIHKTYSTSLVTEINLSEKSDIWVTSHNKYGASNSECKSVGVASCPTGTAGINVPGLVNVCDELEYWKSVAKHPDGNLMLNHWCAARESVCLAENVNLGFKVCRYPFIKSCSTYVAAPHP
jgi:hypothetical protein